MERFYLGLSRMACYPADTAAQSLEGRRILELLDKRAGNIRGSLIATEPGGRPYFADHRADFSLSHSRLRRRHGGMAAAVYLAAPGIPRRAGCDIQYINLENPREGIAEQFFHPPEQASLAAAPAEERARRFYRLWALKEAFLKLRGLSVFDMRLSPCFTLPSGSPGEPGEPGKPGKPGPVFFLYETGDGAHGSYAVAVCRDPPGDPPGEPPEVVWFSPNPPPLKPLAAHHRFGIRSEAIGYRWL